MALFWLLLNLVCASRMLTKRICAAFIDLNAVTMINWPIKFSSYTKVPVQPFRQTLMAARWMGMFLYLLVQRCLAMDSPVLYYIYPVPMAIVVLFPLILMTTLRTALVMSFSDTSPGCFIISGV